MKKLYSLISILIFSSVLFAQETSNRTVKTIIVDALSQLPADKPAEYNKIIKEISSTGEEGILQLVVMLKAPGKGSNVPVDYALNGLTNYAAQADENTRLSLSNTYLDALNSISDREIKAFIIRQLEIVGKDEAILKLSEYLDDATLCGPASRALASIKSNSAGYALLDKMNAVNGKSQQDIILALAYIQFSNAEIPLKKLLNSNDADLEKVTFYALSRLGTKSSLNDLAIAAQKAGYTMEKGGANEAYVTLIKRILAQGDMKDAEKAAKDLLAKSTKAGVIQSRIAALEILMMTKPSETNKLLEKALTDNNREFRKAALMLASDYSNKELYIVVQNHLEKANTDVRADILGWFVDECNCPQKKNIIQSLEMGVFIEQLADNNVEIKSLSAEILSRVGGNDAIIALSRLLKSADKETILLGQKALASTKGNIDSIIISIPDLSEDGRIAVLQLLADRKSASSVNYVFEQISTASPCVKSAAYTTLKDVVSAKDLQTLFTLLDQSDSKSVVSVQQAISSALKNYTKEKQLEVIIAEMNQVDQEKQYLYYTLLATTGVEKALNLIIDRFEKETGRGKDAAFQALLTWDGIESADILFSICNNPSYASYFTDAMSRYLELVSDPQITGENRRLNLCKAMTIAKTNDQRNSILNLIGQTNTFLGMMFAGEYLSDSSLQESAANAVMKIALANRDFDGENVKELLNKVMEELDNPDADYQRQAIRKHLSEMTKSDGYISIFNGKDLSGWKGLVKDPITRAKMKSAELSKEQAKADEQMHKDWDIKDGAIIYLGKGYNNICTIKEYGDIEMYVDWKLDSKGPEPDGGIYLRGIPQVQMWDISRIDVGAQVGSGGLYNNQQNPSTPLKVMDNKLGEWNTFYIKIVGDRVTVKLNGELVVNNVILENYWDHSQPIPPIGQLELQAHGCPIYYKNIYVKELESSEPFKLSSEEQREDYKVLFDGTNMHQWIGNTVDYILEDGCISMHPSSRHGGNLYTKDEYENFIFRFEFQLTPGANNGLGIRTPMEGDAAYVGMELQILDSEAPVYSNLEEYQYHGSVYGIIPAKRGYLKPVGEWNYQEVIANADNIKIILNGYTILDGNIKEATKDGMPDKKEHPGLFNKEGHIGFLGHGSPVKFKNIRIRELK